MRKKLRVGFENPEIRSVITDNNPDLIPVVSMDTHFVFGKVVALFNDKREAEEFVRVFNSITYDKA